MKRWVMMISATLLASSVCAGNLFTGPNTGFVVRADGTAWGWGQTGDDGFGGSASSVAVPVRIGSSNNVAEVGGDTDALFVLLKDGSLLGKGYNGSGRLGTGDRLSRNTFAPILAGVAHVSTSSNYTLAVKSDGSVWAWGKNVGGALGTGDFNERIVPTEVQGLNDIVSVKSGPISLALKRDGTVWAWGSNCCGLIGDGTNPDLPSDPAFYRLRPVQVKTPAGIVQIARGRAGVSLALRNDGTVWTWGYNVRGVGSGTSNYSTPQQVAGLNGIKQIAASGEGGFALDGSGQLWAWGANWTGIFGIPDNVSWNTPRRLVFGQGLQEIALNDADSVFGIKPDGTILSWGGNSAGTLGQGTVERLAAPALVKGPGGVGLMNLNDTSLQTNHLPYGGTIESIGIVPNPTSAPATFTLRVKDEKDTDGSISSYRWVSSDGQIFSGETVSVTWPLAGQYNLQAVATDNAGGTHTLVFSPSYLAPNSLSANPAPMLNAAFGMPMFVANDGTFRFLGSSGLAGGSAAAKYGGAVPDFLNIPFKPNIDGVINVSGRGNVRLAVRSDGSVLGWGMANGAFGTGATLEIFGYPQGIAGLSNIRTISGSAHALALDGQGNVFAAGNNEYGQLGLGDRDNRSRYFKIPNLPPLKEAVTSEWSSFALDRDGGVWAWGRGDLGQMGDGNNLDGLVPQKVSGLSPIATLRPSAQGVFAIAEDGKVYGWGGIDMATMDNAPLNRPALAKWLQGCIDVSAYYNGACVKSDGSIWTWGRSQLGDGTTEYRSEPKPIPGVSDAVDVEVGYGVSYAMRRDGSVLSWGENSQGALGDGSFVNRNYPSLILNDTADGFLSLLNQPVNQESAYLYNFLLRTDRYSTGSNSLNTLLTDKRAAGFDGDVYFTALLPPNSPLLSGVAPRSGNTFADAATGTVPVSIGRGGVKQTGPGSTAAPTVSGTGALTAGNSFAVYSGLSKDPLKDSSAVICMGVTVPALSAKGQVLMRPIANGSSVSGVTQCPTVQTAATTQLYRASNSGTISNLTLTASITPQPEDRGQVRNVYSWAIAPNGQQFMQTGDNQWSLMAEPMLPAKTITVPQTGDVTLPVVAGLNLSSIPGTLVYVGLGSSWAEVKMLNKAGHYFTVQ